MNTHKVRASTQRTLDVGWRKRSCLNGRLFHTTAFFSFFPREFVGDGGLGSVLHIQSGDVSCSGICMVSRKEEWRKSNTTRVEGTEKKNAPRRKQQPKKGKRKNGITARCRLQGGAIGSKGEKSKKRLVDTALSTQQ